MVPITNRDQVRDKHPVDDYFSSAEEIKETVWFGHARADLIHFFNFRNLDRIKENTNSSQVNLSDSTRTRTLYMPFHEYASGAYTSYAPIRGKGSVENYPYYPYIISQARDAWGIDVEETPEIEATYIRGGTYTTGQLIPISVKYQAPAMHMYPTMYDQYNPTLNIPNNSRMELSDGQILRPEIRSRSLVGTPGGYGSLSFIRGYYAVANSGATIEDLRVVRSRELATLTYYLDAGDGSIPPFGNRYQLVHSDVYWNQPFTNENEVQVVIQPHRSEAFKSISLDKTNYKIGEIAKVTVELKNDNGEADWIFNGVQSSEDLNKKFRISVGDRYQGIVPLDWIRDENGQILNSYVLEGTFKVTEELYNGRDYKGRLRAKIYYNHDSSNEENIDVSKFIMWRDQYVYFTIDPPKYITKEDLIITYPNQWPSGAENVIYLTSDKVTQLSYSFPNDATYQDESDFEWISDYPEIATIDQDGKITPLDVGEVTFTLVAKNGGYKEVRVQSEKISIKAGGDPAVVVPDFASRIYVKVNEPATVVWTTNVMHKYKELADSGTPQDAYFTVELYEGYYQDESDLSSMTALQMWNASDTPELVNAMSFTIPKGVLSKVSTSQTPSYTVRISTSHPSQPSITLSALAYIVVNSQPIVVTLDKSMGSYIKDKDFEYIDLKWDIQNYDKVNGADFEFKITKNGQLVKYISGFDGSSSTESGGSYRLNIDKVSETNRLKDSYVITLAAKNQLDTGWSYDSLYLQVYRSEAFRIQVDGVPKDSHTMSNVDAIRNMSHEDRLKLKRKINLQNDMTINYGDYTDVSMFSDQFIWKSSNNEVGAIYYASSGRIADIETFGYSSYQPTSRFILAGIEDGQTTITATHANTGMTVDLNVTVETLRDKLYWFQFYPKVKTTITYTDKKGVEKTVESNEHGELALFENNGIGSDVYATSYVSDNQEPEKIITYTGVISREALLSKEKDPSTLELYPINILQLRKLSEVEVYFKKPDGKPYTGKVTYRAGVYKNGEYAPAAEIGGSGITEQLGSDGRLMITFDTTKFYTEKEQNAANLSAKDKIEIVVEVFFEGDNYFPQLLYFDGDTSPTDAIIFGDKISELIENPKKQKTPFMVNQFVTVEQNEKLSILTYTGKFGPNNYYPSIILTTEFMWWGEQVDEEKAFAELLTDTEAKPQGQSYQTLRYPFSDIIITRHEQVINSETIWLGKAESGTIHYRLYKDPGDFRQSFVAKAKLINMLGVEDVDVNELKNWLEDLRKKMEQSNTNLSSDGQFDPMVTDAMELLNKLSFSFGPLTMKLFPTDDPSVFQSIVYLNVSNLPKVANNPQGGGSSQVENLEVSKYSVTPGLMDIYRTYKGTFKQNAKEEALKDLYGGESHRNTLYSVGGYYLGEIRYNKSTDKWEHYVVGGGFNVGGGVEFVKNYNTFLGPIPVTFSMSVGGAVQVDFKASILYDEIEGLEWSQSYKGSSAVNDYLTSLRVLAYLELFGGVGLDFTIAAAKVGTFGRITIEDITRWLNRDYLENASERVKTGNMLTLEGIVGVRAVIKFLFLSVKYDFASYRYSHSWVFLKWKEIEDYWQKHFRQPLTAENVNMAIALYQAANVIDDLQMQETMTVEDRSYLLNGGRTWNTAGTSKDRFSLMKIDEENGAPLKLQTNAYPYAYPQLADDGSLFVYLSDGNSDKIEDTVASWAIRDLNGYVDMGAIDQNKGYGDSNLKVAGEGDLIAAVWVRQKEKIDKDPGDEIKNEDIVLMANSTEIMAGIYQNKVWTSYSLTNNDTPDLGPVVAVGGGKVFVAYRSTGPANAKNPLDFTTSDAIVYTIYNTETGKWSDVQYLYNGTNGKVMGLSATALEDGTVAVVYTVNNEEVPDKGNITSDYLSGKGNEIVYAVIDKNGNVIKNLQVTYDDLVNENPQITTAMFPDNKERFVIAWHTTNMVDGELVQDIKLLAVNADGEVYVDFIDSLNILQTHHNLKINSNFAFARMKRDWRSIENLSILWKETETEYRNGTIVTRDAVRTVKFGVDMHEDNSFALYLSGVIDVATMPDYTVVDSIDAYVSDPPVNEIKAVILGTTYTTDAHDNDPLKELDGNSVPVKGDDIPIDVTKTVSVIYTATETYSNRFEVDEVSYSPNEIVTGYDMPILFRIVNQGMSKINEVSIQLGKDKHEFKNLNLLPNSSHVLIVYYEVPNPVVDEQYVIEAVFADSAHFRETGTIRLDVPDIGISKVNVVEEKDGKRILTVPIYNVSAATLEGKGWTVKLGLYSGNQFTDEERIGSIIEIKDNNDLALMDDGGYVQLIEFDIKKHLATRSLSEIPIEGVTIFLNVWVEDASGNVIDEFNFANNQTNVLFENLASKYNENNVLLTLEQMNIADRSIVNLRMQNMHMAPISGGNVLLNLLDENGEIIESTYLANNPSELLSFDSEEVIETEVQFSQKGNSVQSLYFTTSTQQQGVSLNEVSISGVKLNFEPQKMSYQLIANDLKKTTIMATASQSDVTISLLDENGQVLYTNNGFISYNMPLQISSAGALNQFDIEVKKDDEVKTYSFTLLNTKTVAPKLELDLIGAKNADGDFVDDVEVVISAFDVEGYDIEKLRYRINNGSWFEIPYDGKSTLVITTISEIGNYSVDVEVTLTSGAKFALDRETFKIVLSDFDVSSSNVKAEPSTILANGTDTAQIVVTLKDRYGHALSGRLVSLRADGGHSVIRTVNDVTDANGRAVFTVSNTYVETVGYIAKDVISGIELPKVEVRFILNPADRQSYNIDDEKTGKNEQSAESQMETDRVFKEQFFSFEALKETIASKLRKAAENGTKPMFKDTENYWASPYITLLSILDVVRGYGDGTFKPNRAVTRAEFAVMLFRLFPFQDAVGKENSISFTDTQNHWASEEIALLAQIGLFSGYPDGTFRPDAEITREELVYVIMKLLNADILSQTGSSTFMDMGQIAQFAKTAVELAAKVGIITGYPDGTFRPKGKASRAETAVILVKLLMQDPEIKELLEKFN